ncbi:hypothetical protein BMETH_33781232441175, partial [methanotrophic bacterial endosymbiont of Bathymodiolus sp.]
MVTVVDKTNIVAINAVDFNFVIIFIFLLQIIFINGGIFRC